VEDTAIISLVNRFLYYSSMSRQKIFLRQPELFSITSWDEKYGTERITDSVPLPGDLQVKCGLCPCQTYSKI
jgi:hypothetical protein